MDFFFVVRYYITVKMIKMSYLKTLNIRSEY